jgi:four helix bundle protein
MTADELKKRTKKFAIEIVKLSKALPNEPTCWVIGKQLLRCGTSVGANYRSACRARSKADFISKIGIVEEEADETCFWLELISEAQLAKGEDFDRAYQEAKELTAIFTATGRSSKN